MHVIKVGLLRILYKDTYFLEIFQGLFGIITGIYLLLLPDNIICNILYDTIPLDLTGLVYINFGSFMVISSLYLPLNIRRFMSLCMLFLWICMIFYLTGFGFLQISLYILLAISAMFTHFSLWRFKWI